MATESSQKWLERNRPPRVQISYDVETAGALQKRELPMVVGILADLSGLPTEDEPPEVLSKRRFIEIDRDNFDSVMKRISPSMTLTGMEASGTIKFEKLDHFEPGYLVEHVTGLKELFAKRRKLRDLMAKVDGNDSLRTTLLQELSKAPAERFQGWLPPESATKEAAKKEGDAGTEGKDA